MAASIPVLMNCGDVENFYLKGGFPADCGIIFSRSSADYNSQALFPNKGKLSQSVPDTL